MTPFVLTPRVVSRTTINEYLLTKRSTSFTNDESIENKADRLLLKYVTNLQSLELTNESVSLQFNLFFEILSFDRQGNLVGFSLTFFRRSSFQLRDTAAVVYFDHPLPSCSDRYFRSTGVLLFKNSLLVGPPPFRILESVGNICDRNRRSRTMRITAPRKEEDHHC